MSHRYLPAMSSNDHWFDRHFHRPVGWGMKVHSARKFYKYARQYLTSSNKTMAPLRHSSNRSRSISHVPRKRARTHSISSSAASSWSVRALRRVTNANTSSLYHPGVKHSAKVLKNTKGPYDGVHVSKSLSKKIHKVMDDDDLSGTYKMIYYGDALGFEGSPNQKTWSTGFSHHHLSKTSDHPGIPSLSPSPTHWSFTVASFLDAASVLFNGKAPTNTAAVCFDPVSAGNFNYNTTEFTVQASSTTYLLKNNSPITINMDIYLCAPKKSSSHNFFHPVGAGQTTNMWDDVGNESLTVSNALRGPLIQMENGQIIDTRDDRVFLSDSQKYSVVDNLLGKAGMGVTPKMFRTFTDAYTSDVTTVSLQPGQTYKYVMQGPKDLKFTASKYFKNSSWQPLQKWSRIPFVALYQELSNVSFPLIDPVEAMTQRNFPFPNTGDAPKHQLSVEREDMIRVSMPDQTGGITSVSAGVVGNTLQKRRPFLVNAGYTYVPTAATTTLRIQDYSPGSTNPGALL